MVTEQKFEGRLCSNARGFSETFSGTAACAVFFYQRRGARSAHFKEAMVARYNSVFEVIVRNVG